MNDQQTKPEPAPETTDRQSFRIVSITDLKRSDASETAELHRLALILAECFPDYPASKHRAAAARIRADMK